jgi:uncharacterized protein (DUF433 family)/predicted nuclease of predicted toxin-antitoxin system
VEVIINDRDILGGTPVFRGTCVPLQALFDYLEGGDTLEEFLDGYPSVSREMAIAAGRSQRTLIRTDLMRVLIDESIHQRLRESLPGHECQTARYAGHGGLKNGALLTAAEKAKFDVLLTVDQGIEYEQNLSGRTIAVIILRAKSIRWKDLLPLMPAYLTQLESIQPGQIAKIAG